MLHSVTDPQVVLNNPSFSPALNASVYKHINTGEVINSFANHGWEATKVVVMKKKQEQALPYAKHIVKLEHKDMRNNEYAKQIIITNSHDGSCGLRLDIGLLRFACANGLVVGESFGGYNFRHVGNSINQRVGEAVDYLNSYFSEVDGLVDRMLGTVLTDAQKALFTLNAGAIRYGTDPEGISNLARVNRIQDTQDNLWVFYNKVQENLLKGNFKRVHPATKTGFKKARAVKSLSESMRINKELWDLATSYLV